MARRGNRFLDNQSDDSLSFSDLVPQSNMAKMGNIYFPSALEQKKKRKKKNASQIIHIADKIAL